MRFLPLAFLFAFTACADDPAPAVDPAPNASGEVSANFFGLTEAFVRAAPSGGVSAMFVDIENTTDSADTLLAARTNAARRVEIHQTQENADGLSEMVPVEGGLAVPAGETVSLEPGGLHVMLLDLQRDLTEGDTLDVEVEFANRGTMTVRAPIRGL